MKSPHTLVRASAGSGKTYQLTNRFISRLIAGEHPSSILATTFTKAAAGEILHRVLLRLSNAVLDKEALHNLRFAVGDPQLSAEKCADVLSNLCKNIHTLSIQTMDSFFFRLASSFSPELGLPAKFRILDEEDQRALQESSIDQTIDQCEIPELIEILRALGGDRIRMMAHESIMSLVQSAYTMYLASDGRPSPWNAIGLVGAKRNDEELSKALEDLEQQELPAKKDGAPDKRWMNARNDIRTYVESEDWEPLVGKGLGNIVLNWMIDGDLGCYYKRPCSEDIARCILPIIEHAQFVLSAQHAARSAATFSLMSRYDNAFRGAKMSSGQLTFDDPPRLLNESAIKGNLEHIYYRLDARIRHILLDEFQDTSMPQFKLFEPILDELLSQKEDDRSVFVVGDIKQSLYTWRQSEPTLLNELSKRWDTLQSETLSESWRSSQIVLDATNAVFDDLLKNSALQGSPIARGVSQAWNEQYEKHKAAKEISGHVTLSVADSDVEDQSQSNDEVLWSCANQVAEIRTCHPDASIAVLVRQTKHIHQLLYMLNELGIEACEDRGNPLVNAPCVAAAVSMLEFINHPGNSTAFYHAQSTPLGDLLNLDTIRNRDAFASHFRKQISERGCSSILIDWYKHLVPSMDQRGSDRFVQLIELAGQLEDEGKPDIETLVHRSNMKKVEEPGRSQVRVITIHKSKGLEFDAVVVPLLGQAWSIKPESILAMRDDPMGEISKITPYPTKLLQRIHPGLKSIHDECLTKQINEELCCLYVAMTRAKHALHMIVPADKEGRKGKPTETLKLTPAHIIRAALAPDSVCSPSEVLYESGRSNWESGKNSADRISIPNQEIEFLIKESKQSTARLTTGSPTGLSHTNSLLNIPDRLTDTENGMLFGSCVHEVFEHINWIDDPDFDLDLISNQIMHRKYSDSIITESFKVVTHSLQTESIRSMLSKGTFCKEHPAATELDVHQERRFALRMTINNEEQLIQGQFDRLVIGRDHEGIQHIQLIDYKTDADARELDDMALIERHSTQIQLYRQALYGLYNIDPSKVECSLVFTARPGIINL